MTHTGYPNDVYVAEAAHVSSRGAWLEPEDDDQRIMAIECCAAVGVSWIDAVAEVMEDTNCDANTARYMVAESLHHLATRVLRNLVPHIPELGPKAPQTKENP